MDPKDFIFDYGDWKIIEFKFEPKFNENDIVIVDSPELTGTPKLGIIARIRSDSGNIPIYSIRFWNSKTRHWGDMWSVHESRMELVCTLEDINEAM